MALNTVSLPFGYYPDPTVGRPVFNGSIFIGEPDLDPTILANQKTITIRQEGVDTPSVPQPISTSAGGVPVFNGSPAEILVDGSYSMAVLNSGGTQVYYVANEFAAASDEVTAIFDTVADLVASSPSAGVLVETKGYTTAGDGGGATYLSVTSGAFGGTPDEQGDHTVANGNVAVIQVGDSINIEQYGAVGDGAADDFNALSKAIAASSGKTIVLADGETYLTNTAIVHTGDIDLRTNGADKAIIFHNGQTLVPLTVQGTTATTKTLSASQQINNRGWDVADSSGVSVGMLMEVKSTTLWYHDNRGVARKSELHKVGSIVGNTIFSEDPANDGYDTGAETVTLTFYNPIKVNLTNIEIKCVHPATGVGAANVTGLSISHADGGKITNVDLTDAADIGISLARCYRTSVFGGRTYGANAFLTGYGVQTNGCSHTIVLLRSFWECRRGVDISGDSVVSRHSLIAGNTNLGGGFNSEGTIYGWEETSATGAPQFGFGSHGPADHTIYRGNKIAQMHTFINCRGRNEIIEDNYFIGRCRFGAIKLSFGENVRIKNNFVYTGWEDTLKDDTIHETGGNINTRRADWFVEFAASYLGGQIVIEDNDVQIQDRFLTFESTGVQDNVTLARNKVRFETQGSTDAVALAYNEGTTQDVVGWNIVDNDYSRVSGTGAVTRFTNLTLGSSELAESFSFSDTWTPTTTAVLNVAAHSGVLSQFTRVGDVVTFSLSVNITPTASGRIDLGISLPVPFDFVSSFQAAGVGAAFYAAGIEAARITADTTNDRLTLIAFADDTSNTSWHVTGAYRLI